MNKKIVLASMLLASPLLLTGCQSASDFFFDDRDYRGHDIYQQQGHRHKSDAPVARVTTNKGNAAATVRQNAPRAVSVPNQAPKMNSSITRIPNAAPAANTTTPAAVMKAPKAAGPVMVPAAPMASPNAAAVPAATVGQ